MDLKGMKDQFSNEAKDELLKKTDELKQGISQRFGEKKEEEKPGKDVIGDPIGDEDKSTPLQVHDREEPIKPEVTEANAEELEPSEDVGKDEEAA